MNLKIIDKDENEIHLQTADYDYISSKLLSIDSLTNEEPIFIVPTHNLKSGIIFQGEQYKNNEASHYTFDNEAFYISDSNNKLHCLFKNPYNENYLKFIKYFKSICETEPAFLKNKTDMTNIHLEWVGNTEGSILNIRYFLGRKSLNKHVPLEVCNFKIPFDLIANDDQESYRYIFLSTLYRHHLSEFSKDYTQEEFLKYAEDIFTQRRLLDY